MMLPFPHTYSVSVDANPTGDILIDSDRLLTLKTDAPADFDGPGDRWSPETLLVAAVGDCFALTFRGIARASSMPWLTLACEVSGTLDRIDGVSRFTAFAIHAHVRLPAGANESQAKRILAKAESTCLITRSLSGSVELVSTVDIADVNAPEIVAT